MKKLLVISVLLLIATALVFWGCHQPSPAPEKAIAQTLLLQVDSFSATSNTLLQEVKSNTANEQQLQDLFLQTRLAYKTFEWAAEYFVPSTSRFVNGPPVEEVEISSRQIFEPAGLQVIENFLFPKYDSTRKPELIKQLTLLQAACVKYKTHFANIDIFDWQVFDAAKLEVFRIVSLGIAGFDNPLSLRSMKESAAALQSLQKVMAHYPDTRDEEKDKSAEGSVMDAFDKAAGYLTDNIDFNSFNRAEFITRYANPLTTSLTDLEVKLKIHVIRYNRLLNQDAKTIFDTNAFNLNAYSPDPSSFMTDKKIALGKALFSDPILSGSGTRSCQSCHQPEKAFTDGLVKNTVIDDHQSLRRNTPTLLNAALQPSQFYDMRVNTLEDQSLSVVQNNNEMHGDLSVSVKKLWNSPIYRTLFSTAFAKNDRTGIDTLEVMNAIGSYVRSLTLLNSRFDDYMRGNKQAMSNEEVNGFNLFMGKAKCATCHYMPLFNGTFPPRYVKSEAEVIGVPLSLANDRIDSDLGRFDVMNIPAFRHAFKTPTLRNAARTAPYMHNGVFTTLEQVMDFYNKGGGVGLGLKIDNQTLPFDKLDLTDNERNDIIAFIRSLDSR
jgi:cytochrome c peroxidase